MKLEQPPSEHLTAGAAWVHRFLLPLLAASFPNEEPLRCLQLWPDDETEAESLIALGHHCQMESPQTPTLPFPSESFDFAFTGRFPARASSDESRLALARELARVLRSGGAFLTVLGNRLCPLDLSRNGPLLHGPFSRNTLSARDAQDLFLQRAGFAALRLISPANHFSWERLPALKPLGLVLESFWIIAAPPARQWLLRSPLNPTLILWLTRK